MPLTMPEPDPGPNGVALPPAVPPFRSSVEEAQQELARALLYNAQLQRTLNERARETNEIHNQLLLTQAELVRVNEQLEAARNTVGHLEGLVNDTAHAATVLSRRAAERRHERGL